MPALADMTPGGVTTFVRQMVEGFKNYGDQFKVVEVPHGDYARALLVKQPKRGKTEDRTASAANRCDNKKWNKPPLQDGLLALGYLKALWCDICRVWKVRRECRHHIIVTNHFGCETLPIAIRVVLPFGTLISISHTHPGEGAYARHPVRRFVERLCYWSVSEVLFNSAASRRLWEERLNVDHIHGTVVHLGTETPDLTLPADYPLKPKGTTDVVCVARFAHWKGQMNLVRAWGLLMGQDEAIPPLNARLIFIGDGECFQEVRNEVLRIGLGESILFVGHRSRGDLYFNGGDAAVLLSTEPEAFGLVLLEAMSRRLPVLASRLGGITEIVQDGVTGITVDPRDIQAVSNALRALLVSEGKRRLFGENGRCLWESTFTLDNMVRRYCAVFGMMPMNRAESIAISKA